MSMELVIGAVIVAGVLWFVFKKKDGGSNGGSGGSGGGGGGAGGGNQNLK